MRFATVGRFEARTAFAEVLVDSRPATAIRRSRYWWNDQRALDFWRMNSSTSNSTAFSLTGYDGRSGVPLGTVMRHWWSTDLSRPGKEWQYWLATLIYNCAFGVVLTICFVTFDRRATLVSTLGETLWISNCIGFSIHIFIELFFKFAFRPTWSKAKTNSLVVPLVLAAVVVGYTIAFAALGRNFLDLLYRHPRLALGLLFLGLLGCVIWALIMDGQTRKLRAETQELRQREAEEAWQRQAREAELRTLQAQIEPHFLFNTLANVQALIDYEPEKSKRMLEAFIDYLRSSLDASRHTQSTLGEELQLLQRYLDVMQVRMGDRLNYRFDVPDDLRSLKFAPLLLQPLVENAIKYGLEPKIEGGSVTISADRLPVAQGERIRIAVMDDGVGLQAASAAKRRLPAPGSGTGLANVRARLQSLFGLNATISIATNDLTTSAVIEFDVKPA